MHVDKSLKLRHNKYRKTSNTSPRLLLEQMPQTAERYCIGDPACIRDPASIKTLPTCHIKLLCVYRPTVCGVRDLKDEARFSFMLLETV